MENAEYVIFILDGVAYQAVEDPDDGYRSYCKDIEIVDAATIKNKFEPIEVICKMTEDGQYQKNDVLEIYDGITGGIILEIGTENTNDYYPYFVFRFTPENMSLNQGR